MIPCQLFSGQLSGNPSPPLTTDNGLLTALERSARRFVLNVRASVPDRLHLPND